MKKVVVAIPHSHSWFWLQTCIASMVRNPPKAEDCFVSVVIVDNSPWSPAIKGITRTKLGEQTWLNVIDNHKNNKFHASALDCVVEKFHFDYLMALETDVLLLRPDWLQWFLDQMQPTDYAVGMWHHEQFVNPSCTLYRGRVLHQMMGWCKSHPEPNLLRWGPLFGKSSELDNNIHLMGDDIEATRAKLRDWMAGPFAEKRGWPAGTELKERPSGQLKGPGWYEPGQQLHHWAVDNGYTYTVCPSLTTNLTGNLPLQTLYGATMPDPQRQLEAVEMFGNAYAAHLWGGTRALDILKHPVTCDFVRTNIPMWLAREARFWKEVVPEDVQRETLELIRKYGFHSSGLGVESWHKDSPDEGAENHQYTSSITDRDRNAADYVKWCYKQGGVEI